ncbi:MAG TPA: hypothetical protein VFF70_04465 [Anaerolineae bacterium]|nr:hypothetical protein [Anaerolineae bacterium]
MTPIDWGEIFSNALWILGCAIALAAFSYADWRADQEHEKLRAQFARPKFRLAFGLSLVLIGLGLAASSNSIITLIVWLSLTLVFSIHFVADAIKLRRSAH